MHFRNASSIDERRRRLLQDEVVGSQGRSAEPAAASRADDAPRYTPAAALDRQRRVTDLVPARIGTVVLLFTLGLFIAAGLEALYYWMPALSKNASDGRIASLDLDSEGSLGACFSSSILAAAGIVALLIYSLRRHRQDDYKGRYRVWLFAAAVWFMMSLDESASLHEGFKEMMALFTGQRLLGDGSLWWVMAYGLVLGVVGSQLLLEMRECRSSTGALVLAGGCYAAAVVTQLQLLMPQRGAQAVMLEEGLEMLADLLLLLAMGLHARYTIRDIQGLVKHEMPADGDDALADKPKRRKSDIEIRPTEMRESSSPSRPNSSPAPAPLASRPFESKSESPKPAAGLASKLNLGTTRTDPPQTEPPRRLSKAERKALKRMQRMQREDYDE
ncbi:MAG: hypothetical protein HYS13_17160 [Planctomycetia bacterium]|nr:hypothetical protein [Planctomycetia bacterium]